MKKKESFLRFTFTLVIITVLFSSTTFILSTILSLFSLSLSIIIIVPVFFFTATSVQHYILLSSSGEKEAKHFIRYFMASTGLKLFVFTIILVIYALLFRSSAKGFILYFLASYLIFTSFEIYSLLKFFSSLRLAEKES